jgi:hypothetical protein
MKDYIQPIKDNAKYLPLLVTGLIIAGYFISKKLQA